MRSSTAIPLSIVLAGYVVVGLTTMSNVAQAAAVSQTAPIAKFSGVDEIVEACTTGTTFTNMPSMSRPSRWAAAPPTGRRHLPGGLFPLGRGLRHRVRPTDDRRRSARSGRRADPTDRPRRARHSWIYLAIEDAHRGIPYTRGYNGAPTSARASASMRARSLSCTGSALYCDGPLAHRQTFPRVCRRTRNRHGGHFGSQHRNQRDHTP